MLIDINLFDLKTVYLASLSACDDCTADDCGICDIRQSQDAISEILKDSNMMNEE